MRFTYEIQQLLAAGATAFALAVGWRLGCWITDKLLAFVRK